MANEVSCTAVPYDFTKPGEDRLLFPFIEAEDTPAGNSDSIRDNIVHLHWHLLGEQLEPSDPEIDRTYNLWVDVYEEGQRGMSAGEYDVALPGPCQATSDPWNGDPLDVSITQDESYAIRSWIAVTSYLLTDYKFLHE
jgi:hypothetical protein